MKPAAVISTRRDGEPEVHYLIGPQRETLAEAEDDLALWRLLDLGPEERIDALLPEGIETAIGNLRALLSGRQEQGLSIRAGRTAHRGSGGTRTGRMYIVIKVEDGEP